MTTMKKVGDEGWMKVKMRPLDEDLSDGDSVETLSEDSDRDTSTEDGKNPRDDVLPKPAMPDQPSSVDANSGQEKVVDSNLVELDTPGNLADRLSKKLQDVVLVPARNSSHLSDAEMKFRYVVAASALLALICSLLVSSYLLFFKIQAISEESQDYSSVHVLQELDQVISKLQTVLRSENEQRLRDILSNMPPNFMNLNKMTVSEEALQNRKVPIESKDVSVESVDGTEVKSGAEERGFIEEIHLQSSQESNERDVLTQTLPQSTPIHNLSLTVSPQTVPPSVGKVTRAENVSDMVEENPHPIQGEPKIPIVPPPPPVDAPKNENSHEEKQCSNYQNILLSVRRDILSVQQQIYSQIMNNLFDYKIDLYKNLLRLDIDMSCADGTLKRANHKNFMFIRNLQKIISKSSEANFESWYKFYSFSVLPKVRDIVGMLDSVTQGVERELEPGEEDQVGSKADMKSDDFFVRASLPNSDIDSEALNVHQNGFDWRNLNEKIRHLNLKRHKNRGDWLKESTNIKKDSRKNYVELEKGAETGDFSRGGDLDEVGEYHQINKRLDREWHYEEMREENEGETEREIEERNERERENGKHDEYKFDKRRNVKHGKMSYERGCNEEKKESKNRGNERLGNEKKYKVKEEEKVDKRQLEKNKKQEKRRERKDEGRNRREELRFEQSHKGKRGFQEKEKFKDGEITDERKLDGGMKYDRSHGNYEKYESARQQQNKYSNERCRARGRRDSYDRRGRKKSLLNDVTKYMKTAVSGLWDSVEKGIKQVKHYGEAVRSTMKNEKSAKRENEAKSSEYEEWRNEFVKELKDLIRVVKGNPTINSLSEVAKSVKQFFGEGLSKVQTPVDNSRETEEMKGPEGIHEDENKEESHIPGTWYVEASKHRAESRGRYPRTGDSSWFLGLGRHRSYLRRRGIHLDDSGSWFMSSAKHRAEMRRSQTEPQVFLPA